MSSTSKSSRQWLDRQHADIYTKKAKQQGYRSRAVYKLLEIHQKYGIFKKGMVVVDLGAAPGGWSQLAAEHVGGQGKIIAIDLLPIEPIPGVDIIKGDFSERSVYDQLISKLSKLKVDLVISDMAPNFSGINNVDQPRAIYLAKLGLDFARSVLDIKGSFLVKLFNGEGFERYVLMLRESFASVVIKKPKASHAKSREVYVLASNLKMEGNYFE